ncbi:MAG TPA: hypothetical protein VFJ74_17305, partial [Gemmatimonadaceae bacterium]|nr:hypothetical protein [Gemmatimonadaceae bacterium]
APSTPPPFLSTRSYAEALVDIVVHLEPAVDGPEQAAPPAVDYRWDADTTILCATVRPPASAGAVAAAAASSPPRAVAEGVGAGAVATAVRGMSGSVEIEGRDGSWLVVDVAAGAVRSVEVAVWPDVRHRSSLRAPADVEQARVILPGRRAAAAPVSAGAGYASPAGGGSTGDGVDALEVNTAIVAESDEAERTIHFILGASRPSRHVRVARDLLFDVDERSRLAGLWLLNVPPCPSDS